MLFIFSLITVSLYESYNTLHDAKIAIKDFETKRKFKINGKTEIHSMYINNEFVEGEKLERIKKLERICK